MRKYILSLMTSIGLLSSCSADDGIPVLEPHDFIKQAKADSTSVLLDVRTPGEFAEGHLEGAVLLDYSDTAVFDEGVKELDKTNTYYIYCRSGRRSHGAAQKMQKQGFKIYDMEGGILNWKQLGLPIVK